MCYSIAIISLFLIEMSTFGRDCCNYCLLLLDSEISHTRNGSASLRIICFLEFCYTCVTDLCEGGFASVCEKSSLCNQSHYELTRSCIHNS